MDFDKYYIIRSVYPSSASGPGLIRLIYLEWRVRGNHLSRKRDRVT